MRIAIVGAGISGLTAAHVLSRRHDITVFEASDYAGGHTNTIEVSEGSRTLAIDTGFIVFNRFNYPNLCRLFEQLGVDSRDSEMSFSVHCERSRLEYNGTNLDKLFANRINVVRPQHWGMLADILRFNREAPRGLTNGLDDSVSVEAYVARKGYGRAFVEQYLVPLGASLWSCDARKFKHFPIRFVIEFLNNHGMLQVNGRPIWKTVSGGSYRYVSLLIHRFRDRIRLNSPVFGVQRGSSGVRIVLQDGRSESFDEVILATHADQSLRLLNDADAEEQELLRCFPYQENEAVLHTDETLLPDRRKVWASWNYRIPASEQDHISVTYNMNMLQGLESDKTYCVSLNQAGGIEPQRIIRRIRYQHPLFTRGRSGAQACHAALIRRRRISYCGAYWGYGFHEDGVRSAKSVCEAFDMGLDA